MNEKTFNLILDIDNSSKISYIKKILNIIYLAGFNRMSIEMRIECKNKINFQLIKSVLFLLTNFSMKKSIPFVIIVQYNYRILSHRIIRIFSKKNIKSIITLENFNQAYRKLRKLRRKKIFKLNSTITIVPKGIIRNFNRIDYLNVSISYNISNLNINNIIQLFDEWFFDKKGIICEPFYKYLKMVLFKYSTDICEYSSCLGKTVYMKVDGKLYFCKDNKKYSYMCNITSIETYANIFQNDAFEKILNASTIFRAGCKANCIHFSECQGACPISAGISNITGENIKCGGENYIFLLQHIEQTIRDLFQKNTLDIINPVIRKEILTAIAFDSNIQRFIN